MRLAYRFIFFDVDSTLVTVEGIDLLAAGNNEVAELTDRAMNGDIPIDEVYARRLEIIRPTRDQIREIGEIYCRSLTPGAAETLTTLREAGAQIHLVTAGITQAISPLAGMLNVPARAVHSVALTFDADGAYLDFDRRSFLTRAGGKELVVRDVRARSHGKAAFVGDGVTDLDAKPAVDLFIGFGGVQARDRVRMNSDIFITDPDLRLVLPHLLNE